jgi:hypothetical protein
MPLRSVIVTETDSTLATQAVGPKASEVNVGLGHLGVGDEEPDAENGLGKDIKNGVGDDLTIDGKFAGSVSNTPDTVNVSTCVDNGEQKLTWDTQSR